MRNYGVTSRSATGGNDRLTGSHYSAIRSADLPIPSGSILIPSEPPLERSQIAQALIDGIAVVFGFLFLASVAASIPLAVVLLFFASF